MGFGMMRHTMQLSVNYHSFWLDFANEDTRWTWATLLPSVCVLLLVLKPLLGAVAKKGLPGAVVNAFNTYLTIQEAEVLDGGLDSTWQDSQKISQNKWPSFAISFLGLVQTLLWTSRGSYIFIVAPSTTSVWFGASSYLVALTWLYTTIYPVRETLCVAPLDLLTVYLAHFAAGVLVFGGMVYDRDILGAEHQGGLAWIASIGNLIIIVIVLGVVLNLPLAVPGTSVNRDEIGKTLAPEDYCPLWQWMTFYWIYPLIKLGRRKTLQEIDVWDLSPTMQSKLVFWGFARTRESSLLQRLWACNSHDMLMIFFLTICSVVLSYTGPFFMRNILDAIDSKNPTLESRTKAYIFAVMAFVCALARNQTDLYYLFYGRRASIRVKSELMAAIYDKALKRKDLSGILEDKPKGSTDSTTKAGADVGKIVNLMSVDANHVSLATAALSLLYAAPFDILIAGTYLSRLLGVSALAGFALLLLSWPINSRATGNYLKAQRGLLAAKDERMGTINELLSAMKFVKFFAWEDKWVERVMAKRNKEISWIIKARYNEVIITVIYVLTPTLVSIISFFIYVTLGNQLTVSVAFTSIALFNMIRTPLSIVPDAIMQLIQNKVAIDRIGAFLDEDEVTEQVSALKIGNTVVIINDGNEIGLGLRDATLQWNSAEKVTSTADATSKGSNSGNSTTSNVTPLASSSASVQSTAAGESPTEERTAFELKDVNIIFPEGELTIVIGPTASGKTALLLSLLGELTLTSGSIIMSKQPTKLLPGGLTHSISYAAQSPWLRHQSIKDNILFGNEWNQERYDEVVRCCALKPDLDNLEDGDATEIGTRGINLSGGQKARVSLARAVYARTKYVLLDDPLSAVDSHTARHLFDNLICGPLLQGRTVILVTHHVELVLPGAHYVVRMLDGRIDTQGTVKNLHASGSLDDIIKHESAHRALDQEGSEIAGGTPNSAKELAVEEPSPKKNPRKLVQEEHREVGGVKWSVYKTYLKASSYYIWFFLAFIVILSQFTTVIEKYWIKEWGEAYGKPATSVTALIVQQDHKPVYTQPAALSIRITEKGDLGLNWPNANQHPLFYVGVYAAIALSTAVFTILSAIAQYIGAIWASKVLFRLLLLNVLRATMRWHDTTPQGRILNRFGKDIETIDVSLADSLENVNRSLATFFASAITITVVFPWFLVPAAVIGLGYRELASAYMDTSRDLRRMESNSKSPIFSDFRELLEGIVTVRAFSVERQFLRNMYNKIDLTTKMFYAYWMANRWLLLNLNIMGALTILLTTLFSLSGYVSAGTAGLCITSAMAFTQSIYWACRWWTTLELDLNSMERVIEYLSLPQEPAAVIEDHRPPAYWPSESVNPLLTFENITIKYAPDLPAVLHGVSFSLNAKERVGVVGRTGSGKSTLAMSILRFIEPAAGRIIIDNIDISTIGLHDLRSHLTFIPQDATLFSGTLRQNLDPFEDHSDLECLDVLRRVSLIEDKASSSQNTSTASLSDVQPESGAESIISAVPTTVDTKIAIGLDTRVSPEGMNFSQGQRQLIAIARALLKRSSIIILDEATSSIDFKIDTKIQIAIREEFGNSLLLTVAHRLHTIIDYDRLIVMDQGQITEFDTPRNLIQRENGLFRAMCMKSGAFAELEAIVKGKDRA